MKKTVPIIGALVVLALIGFGVYSYTKKPAAVQEETPQKKKVSEPVNVIPVSERPYITITPHADGRNLSIAVEVLNKEATGVEYELEYQAGTLLQGAFGQFDLESVPASEKILLGSCSAGGACTYHKEVKGGSLLTRYEGPENYAVQSDWKYFENNAKETGFASRDSLFHIESPDLASVAYLVVFNTAGAPKELPGTLVSELYSLTASETLSGEATLTIRAKEEGTFTIVGWDGSIWKELETTSEGKTATATGDLFELYAVITK